MGLNDMSDEDIIKSILDNTSYCPCLLLGKLSLEFKKIYKDRIFNMSTLKDVRNAMDDYFGIGDLEGRFFVMDNIGYLSSVGQTALLKFIEESKFPIIMLSYIDRISPVILSRTKFVYKSSVAGVKDLNFIRVRDMMNKVEEKKAKDSDFHEIGEIKMYAEKCPQAMVLKYSTHDFGYISGRVLKIMNAIK